MMPNWPKLVRLRTNESPGLVTTLASKRPNGLAKLWPMVLAILLNLKEKDSSKATNGERFNAPLRTLKSFDNGPTSAGGCSGLLLVNSHAKMTRQNQAKTRRVLRMWHLGSNAKTREKRRNWNLARTVLPRCQVPTSQGKTSRHPSENASPSQSRNRSSGTTPRVCRIDHQATDVARYATAGYTPICL